MSRVLQNAKKPWDLKDNCISVSIHASSEDYKKKVSKHTHNIPFKKIYGRVNKHVPPHFFI